MRFEALASLVAGGGVVVLSGAGLSTESGIPDYRGPSGVARRHTPMTYQTFTRDAAARRRYWARSHLGWRLIARARPNDGHRAVARLQQGGLVDGIVTQNVDGLHTAAGATGVVELHGRLDEVVCLRCGDRTSREELDLRLRQVNPGFDAVAGAVNPDGDVELGDEQVAGFRTVGCAVCGTGMLKPDVVFFGETVPAERVAHCFALVEAARLLLVLGSSLAVMSGRRFVLRAAKLGVPVVIVNQGPTRGDAYAAVTVDAPLGRLLPALADRLVGGVPVGPGRVGAAPAGVPPVVR
ncbi:NAD-dependent protein deacetylase, SIR2 family [Micromonospora nigra]|uniref:NAD-dependent protein deacetylase n=1 Tax=Micromonospora nigra TaxID=145857 RepID=A0A1C6T4M3_9ACTN|nr:NAD-dependent protein deacetylase, SIR2 family [Micromonospora nigra]